ncbi:MAG TPA: phosphatase PAP2 family protein [Candidatus Thermoplasmatota archaeon]|nr:phosphatase PAP2 family protein [Candidatus Thermoplasmatota archaeon]
MPPASGRPETPPVAWRGIALMFAVLGIFFATGIARAGLSQSLYDLGLRRPSLALFTLLLISPAFFEMAYPALWRVSRGPGRVAVERLHLHAPYLIAIGTMMVVMRFENTFDLRITAALGLDFTRAIQGIEGNAVEVAQAWLRGSAAVRNVLDPFLIFVYLTVFAVYHLAGIIGFALAGKGEMVRRFTVAWVGIYAVALPFYLFFPVNEVWVTNIEHGGTSSVANVLGDGSGLGQDASFAIASINNCFPSLHNAFAWALPMLLLRSGWRRLGGALSGVAFLISLSTVYLGIHWFTDLAAGIALAWGVVHVAMNLDYRLTHGMRIVDLRWRGRPIRPPAPQPSPSTEPNLDD